MLRYHNYDIVFQEVPGEVTLAINLSNCPNRCKACHSPHLQQNVGNELTETVIAHLLEKYGNAITCMCFMGGDVAPHEVQHLAAFVKIQSNARLKTAWYSGKAKLPENININLFNYIKTGPYLPHRGGLSSPHTNQRFYTIGQEGSLKDDTVLFWK
jgi:anaerobic ribonucleoside-triphosphate reductase activating protein